MTDKDQNNSPDPNPFDPNPAPDPNPADNEEDLENLTSDEKAAFEKIMSQIGDANDDLGLDTTDSAPDRKNPSVAGEKNKTGEIKTAAGNTVDMAEPQQTASSADEELTDDQQAALDNIMAEINGDDANAPEKDEPESASGENESLTDEQQAALDNIMAEIKGQDDGAPEKDEPVAAADDGEALSDEQQAALDNIMAEIKDRDDEAPEKDEPVAAADDGEALSDEQQAALDNIMAEIKDRDDGASEKDEAAAVSNDNQALNDDRQAALEKVMAEINDAKGGTADGTAPVSEQAPAQPDLANGNPPTPAAEKDPNPSVTEADGNLKEELSLDEFNHELNSLLDAAQVVPDQRTSAAIEPARNSSDSDRSYAMLQEVGAGAQAPTAGKKRKKRAVRGNMSLNRSIMVKCALAASLLVMAAGAYWGYGRWYGKSIPEPPVLSTPPPGLPALTVQTAPVDAGPFLNEAPSTGSVHAAANEGPPQRDLSPFALLASDLAAARRRLENKIEEIKELKAYYRKGINEERRKIESQIPKMRVPTFKKALADSHIDLSLQAIQRRETYIAKLDTPLKQLADLSEKLLYLERRNHLLELLDKGLSGLPIAQLKKDVAGAVAEQMEKSGQLTIDQVKVPTPTLASIWEGIRRDEEKTGGKKRPVGASDALNHKIMQEICMGDYGRKYLLTAMTGESAKCLSQWQGKDLYLNNLTSLPPAAAKALARWPGEWMSLNGLASIPVESALYLSQWPGKRLSLNGLSSLSSKATEHLSKWHGEQLEMVGLKSIGRWENYGTRLFLSEKLKRKLKRP